ncbi:hypothetical protein C7C46_23305 [Streptomyces tateyamensis]|uniref:DUF4259 domain-containing protein n=1 Tax=Streptomyces tateyamensis TaxID=565073 RepID=A0A2V4NX29_9ACTN|nr:DUF4259 domain-containing protein [Streptomyces tateyamensis]PYC75810.1 hypothetical protein C7C46_23305 [Streptomyces tateyamensis]
MGTWDFGPFDNDPAADFAGELDEAVAEERARLVVAVLERVSASGGYLSGKEGDVAVAAAALVAAQCPGGEPVDPSHGPKRPIPGLDDRWVGLALRALERVLGPKSELVEFWDDSGEGLRWRERTARLRRVLEGDDPV